jgi:hypothetical protein
MILCLFFDDGIGIIMLIGEGLVEPVKIIMINQNESSLFYIFPIRKGGWGGDTSEVVVMAVLVIWASPQED